MYQTECLLGGHRHSDFGTCTRIYPYPVIYLRARWQLLMSPAPDLQFAWCLLAILNVDLQLLILPN